MANNNNYAKFIPVLISAAAAVLCTNFFRNKKTRREQKEKAKDERQHICGTVEGVQRNSTSIRSQVSDERKSAGTEIGLEIEGRLNYLFTNVSTVRKELERVSKSLEKTTTVFQNVMDSASINLPSELMPEAKTASSEDWCSSGSSKSFLEDVEFLPPACLSDESKQFSLPISGADVSDVPHLQTILEGQPVLEEVASTTNAGMNAIRLSAFEGAHLPAIPAIDPNGDGWTPAVEEAQRGSSANRRDERPTRDHRRQKVVYEMDDI